MVDAVCGIVYAPVETRKPSVAYLLLTGGPKLVEHLFTVLKILSDKNLASSQLFRTMAL